MIILGLGCAVPEYSVDQKESANLAVRLSCNTPDQERLLGALYRRTGIRRRGSVLLDGMQPTRSGKSFYPDKRDESDHGPGTRLRMERYEDCALQLALTACREALAQAETRPADLTHLITVSCTGFYAPGLDAGLVKALQLSPSIRRVHVGFMGCHGLLNALAAADAFAALTPAARVLLCSVELCTLHFQYGWDPERVVCNALFADGAGALVGGQTDKAGSWELSDTGSFLVPDSSDGMTWRVGDHGFEMSLSASVPHLISRSLPTWMDSWLQGNGLRRSEIASWAIHPGGPRILDATVQSLQLPESAAQTSREVLVEHGNMSSATLAFILKRLYQQGASLPCVAIAFGPGLTIETALFR